MHFTFLNLLDILGFVQGILLGSILILSYKKNKAIPFLGIFLIGYSSEFLTAILRETGYLAEHPEYLFLPFDGYFLFMPALYLYTKCILHQFSWRKDFIHFIPPAIEFISFSILFTFPAVTKLAWDDAGIVDLIQISLAYFFILGYSVIIIRLINRHKRALVNHFSSIQGKTLQWVQWVCYYVLYTLIIILLPIFLTDYHSEIVGQIFNIINVVFIFWVALSGFRQVFINLPEKILNNEKGTINANDEVTQNQQAYEALITFMQQEKPYTNPQLQLSDLAKAINYSPRKLSNLINDIGGLNFNQFINQFRVEAAKKLLLDPEMGHLNLLGIAYQVGFNSKTSFYTTFKQMVGKTPNQFKKEALLFSS